MNQKILKDYFSFTKRERVAVLCLVTVGILLFVLPALWPESKPVILTAEYLLASRALDKAENPDSLRYRTGNTGTHEKYLRSSLDKSRLFYFDPNVLTPAGWEKMGLRPKTIHTIQNYLSKGGHFRSPEDLGKIYGLHPDEISRLVPFVRIPRHARNKVGYDADYKKNPSYASYNNFTRNRLPALVDINTADTSDLIALPGIGSKLSARIIRFRELLGGFYSLTQVGEVYGLPDSTFQRIVPRLVLAPAATAAINLNTSDENRLKSHPYIKWNVARAIVNYREQHGQFKSIGELKQLDCIDEVLFDKLSHYVMVSAD